MSVAVFGFNHFTTVKHNFYPLLQVKGPFRESMDMVDEWPESEVNRFFDSLYYLTECSYKARYKESKSLPEMFPIRYGTVKDLTPMEFYKAFGAMLYQIEADTIDAWFDFEVDLTDYHKAVKIFDRLGKRILQTSPEWEKADWEIK